MLQDIKKKNIILEYSKFLIIFLLIFIPIRNVLELYVGYIIKIIPDVLIFGLLLGYFISVKGKISIKLYDIIFGTFLVISIVNSVFFHEIPMAVCIFQIRSIVLYYIMFFVIRNYAFFEEFKVTVATVIRYVTYVLFVFGIVEKISLKTVLFPKSIAETIIYADNFSRVYSLFFNPNTYGAYLVLSFFIVLYFNNGERRLLTYKIVTVVSLLLSMSRSSLILFLMLLIGYVLFIIRDSLRDKKKELLWQMIIVMVVGILSYALCEKMAQREMFNGQHMKGETTVYERMKELGSEEIIEKSNTDGRLFYLKTGLRVFEEHPILGTGFGTYGSAASMNWKPPIYKQYDLKYGFYADNEYIKDLVETGIVGIILFGTFLISILYAFRKQSFCVLFCIGIGWLGLFYNVFEVQIVAFLLWSLLGVESKNEKNRK